MGRWPIARLRRALFGLLYLFLLATGANAQSPAGGNPLREVQIPQTSFTLGEPVPAWVERASVAQAPRTEALVLPLVDTQYMLGEEPVVYVHRSVKVNDAASLTQAGHVAVVFVPQYHRLRLHAIRVLRGAETFDRTNSSPVRFLQRETVKLVPNSATVLMCRAAAHFSAGEFEKSVDDYSKAITLGATDAKALHLRGMAKFYAGRLADAADDFLRAADTDDREAQLMNDLWLAWTHQRLGRPLPQAVRERAAEEPRGAWPRPALATLAGDVAPEEMLKLIERKWGDERTMALAEGYFYLAQYYLGRGEAAKARKLFEDTRRLNVIIYVEHAAAVFELQRLGASTETGAVSATPSVSGSSLGPSTAGPGGPQSSQKKAAPKGARKAPDSWNQELWRRQ